MRSLFYEWKATDSERGKKTKDAEAPRRVAPRRAMPRREGLVRRGGESSGVGEARQGKQSKETEINLIYTNQYY